MSKLHDICIEILQKTNDGDKLSPPHLRLVEIAVNNGLSESGEIALNKLHQNVLRGYKPDWFHGIEHLTIDHEGYVYWKNIQVEHYTPSWAYSAEARVSAIELVDRCRIVEKRGDKPTTCSVIWNFENTKS